MPPPPRTEISVAVPPLTISLPPLETVVLLAVPPDSTTCDPVKTVTPLAVPNTSCSPPDICAPRSVPKALTISLPPSLIVVLIAVPP
jgi:hypothetical protein